MARARVRRLIMWLYRKLKKPLIILAAIAVLLGAVGVFLLGRGCGDRPRSSEAVPTATGAPPGWVAPPEDFTSPWPHLKKTAADKKLKDWPAGSQLVEVTVPPGASTVEIGILPGGQVVVPAGAEAIIYRKPPANVALELRPWLGGGAGLGGLTAGAGVDALRLWRVHLGAGVTYDQRENVAGVLATSYNVGRNIDVRVVGGYGTGGAAASALLTLAIE